MSREILSHSYGRLTLVECHTVIKLLLISLSTSGKPSCLISTGLLRKDGSGSLSFSLFNLSLDSAGGALVVSNRELARCLAEGQRRECDETFR